MGVGLVTATASKPDTRGQYAQTTISTTVNASRSVPSFSASTYTVSGYVFNDLNMNGVKDGSYRHLDVKTVNKDLKVQARKGYYAIKPESR